MKRLMPTQSHLAVYTLFSLMPFWASAQSLICAEVHKPEIVRGTPAPKVIWNDDASYITAIQRSETYGQVRTFFSKKWDTQVYSTNTALPNHKGEVPLVDPEAKAVYIFFHGSGTSKSSGRNFIANMNTLSNLGYSAFAVDMPFHAEGPRSREMTHAFRFMEWMKEIVTEARKSGKPIYLAGHSFGPDVILEFAARYPKLIDGVVALSPASFTKELDQWYINHTTKMTFGGDVPANDNGGTWAAMMSKQFLWSKGKLADPTRINPHLRIRILSGDREEYVPAPTDPQTHLPVGQNTYDVSIPLRRMFQNATITVEPGIGHYLFEHLDSNGHNVVLRELLAVDHQSPSQVKKMIDDLRTSQQQLHLSGQLEKKYVQDELFRAWADLTFGNGKVLRMAREQNDILSAKILTNYQLAQAERNLLIQQRIIETKNTHPEFYEKFKASIDALTPKKVDGSLFKPYLNLVLRAEGN